MRLEAARVMADMIAFRTATIDDAVRDAIASGANWNDRFARGEAKVGRGAYMRIAVARREAHTEMDRSPQP